jgi:hypothetical protein
MSEEKKASTWLPVLIAAIPISAGIFQYYTTRQTEFRKQFWEEQINLYKQAADAASEIAMAPSLEASTSARKTFWRLYWAKLSILEDKEVEQAMISFGARLGECESGKGAPCFGVQDGSAKTDLRLRSYHLAHCLRFSLLETWNPAKLDDSRDTCPHTEKK